MSERRILLYALVAAAILVVFGSRRIAEEHELIRLGYDLTEARSTLRHLDENNRRLKLEQSVLVSPQRLRPLAFALGMREPDPTQIRVVESDDLRSEEQ